MVRTVWLDDAALAALHRERRPGETDSEVVLRLLAELGRTHRNSPFLAMRTQVPMDLSPDQHKAMVRRMRDGDRKRPPADIRDRPTDPASGPVPSRLRQISHPFVGPLTPDLRNPR